MPVGVRPVVPSRRFSAITRTRSVPDKWPGRRGGFPPDAGGPDGETWDMSDMRIVGVEAERLARIRERDADEFGNALTARTAQGWEPLRCCLNRASEGERIALICYTPWSQPSPWLE